MKLQVSLKSEKSIGNSDSLLYTEDRIWLKSS